MKNNNTNIRVRFAPSPTGYLHIGGLRTALFNWLFARHNNGKFLVRIEDTDKQRSKPEYTQDILNALDWTKLLSDESMVYQSELIGRHRELVDKLLKEGKAYKCFCPEKKIDDKETDFDKYNKVCRNYNPVEKDLNGSFVVRFKLPDDIKEICFNDLIRGEICFDIDQLDDFVILRPDGNPTYNFVVVVDDADMGITHVIRGEDHISNTPKQILLYKALGFVVPDFAHLPLILGSSGQKLSKRDVSTAVLDYSKKGYLPEALCNYLVRLGWSHGDQEIFTQQELVKYFSLESVGKKGSIFDLVKLDWVNGIYIKQSSDQDIYNYIIKYIDDSISKYLNLWDCNKILEAINLYKDRSKTLFDLVVDIKEIYKGPSSFDDQQLSNFDKEKLECYMCVLENALFQLEDFNLENLKKTVKNICTNIKIKMPDIAKPLRLAIAGKESSPGIFDLLILIGKEESIRRINKFREYMK